MKKIETNIPGVWIIEPQVFGDHRGYFMETYSTATFAAIGIDIRPDQLLNNETDF